MKQLFNSENPVFQILTKVCDMMIGNLLFLLCSLPIVTLGASATALNKIAQDIVLDPDQSVAKRFFQTFRENFKQSTILWLLLLLFLVCMGLNVLLVITYASGILKTVLYAVILIFTVVVLSICSYAFPLIARYQNTLRQHLTNSIILLMWKLPRTVGLVLLNTAPFWLLYFSAKVFFSTTIFWLLLGYGFIFYADSLILAPVFRQLEKEKAD